MPKKLLRILYRISQDIKDPEFDSAEVLDSLEYDKTDLSEIWENREEFECFIGPDKDALDIFEALLVYLLMRDCSCRPGGIS
jgi:hypothetical protein